MGRGETKLVVFNLPEDVRDRDIEDIFSKFGRLRSVAVKPQARGSMAFLEYEDPRDAEDAKERRHGWTFEGERLRVEFSKPKRGDSRGGRADSRRRGGGGDRGGRGPTLRDSWYRLKITNMPASASWQDMKDFLRKGGNGAVKFTEITGSGQGVAGFATKEELDRVIDDLDDAKFTARNGETSHVTIKADGGGDDDRRSRSRGRSNSRR